MYDTQKIPRYSESDYLYSSARVRALEVKIFGTDKCARLAEMNGISEVYRAIEENRRGASDAASMLREMLSECFEMVDEMTGHNIIFDIWRFPYDCHNIKSAVKCAIRGRDPIHLMYEFGTVSPNALISAIRDSKYDIFPNHMAQAIPLCISEYAKTHDPQCIDIMLDSACYRDMSAVADASGIEFIKKIVAAKIDLTNILTAVRISRMKNAAINVRFLNRMLLPGGLLRTDVFSAAVTSGEDEFYHRLKITQYSSLADKLSPDSSLTSTERICDDFYMKLLSDVKYKVAGAEVIAAYIAAVECQAKNLRIIIAGKNAGLPSETIRERLRASYV